MQITLDWSPVFILSDVTRWLTTKIKVKSIWRQIFGLRLHMLNQGTCSHTLTPTPPPPSLDRFLLCYNSYSFHINDHRILRPCPFWGGYGYGYWLQRQCGSSHSRSQDRHLGNGITWCIQVEDCIKRLAFFVFMKRLSNVISPIRPTSECCVINWCTRIPRSSFSLLEMFEGIFTTFSLTTQRNELDRSQVIY